MSILRAEGNSCHRPSLRPRDFGVQGLVDVIGVIEEAGRYNPVFASLATVSPCMTGYVLTHRDYAADLRRVLPDAVFDAGPNP